DKDEKIKNALKETQISGSMPGVKRCTISYLKRFTTRKIKNEEEFLDTIKEVFKENYWNIQTVSFDDASLESQYITMQNTDIFLSTQGTGSHMATFLREGSASVEISALGNSLGATINKDICRVIPTLKCYVCPTTEFGQTWKEVRLLEEISVDIEALKAVLEEIHGELNEKCM
ncbi:MAG: glycosyltransferase 61 family protein, partial [Flavobacteriales bacterium]